MQYPNCITSRQYTAEDCCSKGELVRPAPAIQSALSQLEIEVDSLSKKIDELLIKIEPICSTSPECNFPTEKEEELSCSLAESLHVIRRNVRNVTYKISTTLNQVEL